MNEDRMLNLVFENTRNSYKFFWWLSIIELIVERNQVEIDFNDIVIKMITKMWYPINYFKLSFGKQDKIVDYVNELKNEFRLDDNISEKKLETFLRAKSTHNTIISISRKLTNYVPHRFLRPWFSAETRGVEDQLVNGIILKLQESKKNNLPYIIDSDYRRIFVNLEMIKLIKTHYNILESFALFKLTSFLERENTNIPNISVKLIKPKSRSLGKVTKLWKDFSLNNPEITDIFESKKLKELDSFSIDHFLPWSYFSHDEIWNTHPVNKTVNSSKSNLLPSTDYLKSYCEIQFKMLQFVLLKKETEFIEQYVTALRIGKDELLFIDLKKFSAKLYEIYIIHLEYASSMGFDGNWKYE